METSKNKQEGIRGFWLCLSQLFGFDLLLLPEPVYATVCVSLQRINQKTSIDNYNHELCYYNCGNSTIENDHKVDLVELVFTNLSSDKSAESKGGELAGVDTISIKVTNVELNRSMILWCDHSVCCRAEQIYHYKTKRISLVLN